MTNDVYAFLGAIICGMLSVVLWNVAEALRKTINAKAIINGLLDVLWWVSVCVVFTICIWEILSLKVRFFEFLGVGIGAFLCHIVLGRPMRYIFSIVFEIFLKIIKIIFKILLTPGAFLYKILVVDFLGKKCFRCRKVAKNDSAQKQDCEVLQKT